MSSLRKLVSLSPSQLGNLLTATGLVASVRVALWVLPLERVRRLYAGRISPTVAVAAGNDVGRGVQQPSRDRREGAAAAAAATAALAVRRASRVVPRASCLTQALATRELLARRGIESRLKVGVAKKDGVLEAHAWVEHDGRIIIGRLPDMDRFAVMPDSALNASFPARISASSR